MLLRWYQWLQPRVWARPFALVVAVLHRFASGWAGLQLPLRTEIGKGLAIAHPFGIIVNGHAKLGCNITLFHGATIGQGDRVGTEGQRETFYPVIEDDVWIGPHAVIVGQVRVGRGSRIMPGTVIVKDVPPFSMVAGNPAKIIKSDCTKDVVNPVLA